MKRAALAGWVPALMVSVLAIAPGPLAPQAPGPEGGDGARTRHVVVISVDGLRPDAIERFDLGTLDRLAREGSAATDARTIFPSKTLPSHTSMLTGLLPEDHGITFNRVLADEENVAVPTIFELARRNGLSTAAFFSKAKFRHLDRPDAYDYWQAPGSNMDNWMATRTVPDAIQYLRHETPNLLFVHIGEPDYAGHTAGWMGFFYGLATRRANAAVERLLEATDDAFGPGNYTVLLTADHGGHEHGHGTDSDQDMLIPWIAWGQGVAAGTRPQGVRTVDTAATVLWLLGVPTPAHWAGQPVRAAFGTEVATPVAAGSAGGR